MELEALRKLEMYTQFVVILSFLALFITGYLSLIYLHEKVHEIIYHNYGVESHIEWFSIEGYSIIAKTVADGDFSSCNDSCLLAHHLNEIVEYPLQVLYLLMGISFFIIIILLMRKDGN